LLPRGIRTLRPGLGWQAAVVCACVLVLVSAALDGCGGPPSQIAPGKPGASSALPPRPVDFGMAVPYPVALPPDSADWRPVIGIDSIIPLVLTVDVGGDVTDVGAVRGADTAFAPYYDRYLKACRFEPGLAGGSAVAFRLPILLHLRSWRKRPLVAFPVNQGREIVNSALYFEAFELNGVTHAGLEWFPSYFHLPARQDGSSAVKFVLAELDFDTTGRPQQISLLRTTSPDFAEQILTAMNWARYTPAKRRGQPVPGHGIMAVLLFTEIAYPAPPVSPDQPDTSDLLHAVRVRLVPAEIGLLMPAVPRNARQGRLTLSGFSGTLRTRVGATAIIDTLGKGHLRGVSDGTPRLRTVCDSVIQQLRFYPAFDFMGNPRAFTGLMYIEFTGSTTVRIDFAWLNQPTFRRPSQPVD